MMRVEEIIVPCTRMCFVKLWVTSVAEPAAANSDAGWISPDPVEEFS